MSMASLFPQNLRRMRDFYKIYSDDPEWQAMTKQIGWTQNVVLLEADLTAEQHAWYLQAVLEFGWSKNEIENVIETSIHEEITLAYPTNLCYIMNIKQQSEHNENDHS